MAGRTPGADWHIETRCGGARFEYVQRNSGPQWPRPRVRLKHLQNGEMFWMNEDDLVSMLEQQQLSLFVRYAGGTYRQVSGVGTAAPVAPPRVTAVVKRYRRALVATGVSCPFDKSIAFADHLKRVKL